MLGRATMTFAGRTATKVMVGPRGVAGVEGDRPPVKIAFSTNTRSNTITTMPPHFTYLKTTAGSGPLGNAEPLRVRCGPRLAGDGSGGGSGAAAARSVPSTVATEMSIRPYTSRFG